MVFSQKDISKSYFLVPVEIRSLQMCSGLNNIIPRIHLHLKPQNATYLEIRSLQMYFDRDKKQSHI